MESLGEYLRRVREEKGISIEEGARVTRVPPEYLVSMEENDFALFSSPVMAYGFLRVYARYLSLNEEDVVERCKREVQFSQADPEGSWRILKKRDQYGEQGRGRKTGVGVALLLLLILFLSFFGDRFGRQETSPVLSPSSSREGAEEGEEFPHDEVPLVSEDLSPIPESPPPEEHLSEPLLLSIVAVEECWILVHIDDIHMKEVLLRPGERVIWKAQQKFLLTIGNAWGVKVEFNGRPLNPLGPRGKVVRGILLGRG